MAKKPRGKAIKIEENLSEQEHGMCDGLIENFHVHARHDIVNLFSLYDTYKFLKLITL